MNSVTCFNRRFTPNWWMTILALLAIIFFSRLGYWQLARAEEKNQMLMAQASLAKQAPFNWDSQSRPPKQYQPVKVSGKYLSEILLLDNQHQQHQFGYNVLSPLLLNSGEVILIDRGWVQGDTARQKLPEIMVPQGLITLSGYAYYPSEKTWILGQASEEKGANLSIVERIDTKLISEILHKSVYPFIIRLAKDDKHGFLREWPIVAMAPERHYAYALQWFAIASVIVILFIALNLKKKI